MNRKKFDLEDRLIDFGVQMIQISESVDMSRKSGRHLAGQLVRSGTSAGIHYGETQSAESRNDFIHKLKLNLKELNETKRNLKMIEKVKLHKSPRVLEAGIKECGELVAIFVKSIQTAERNRVKSRKNR